MLPDLNICKKCSYLTYIYKIRCGNVSKLKHPYCHKLNIFLNENYIFFNCEKQ